MRGDRITAVTFGCVMAVFLSWQGLEYYGEDGLTFKEWIVSIVLAGVVGALGAWQGYVLVRRFNRGPDDED